LNRTEISYPAPESAKDVLKNGDEIKAVIMNHIKEDNPIYLSMTRLLDNLVGTEFEAKVLEIDEKKNRLVLSRRAVLEVERQAKLAEALKNINVGDNYKGIVRKIMPYGAFVDIGGIEGLLHISDISWQKIKKVEDVLSVGQEIFVAVNDDIQGLLHISQITKQRNAKVEDYLNRGQEVEVKIISLNKDEKKLGLALTELMEAKETAEDAE